MKAVEVNSPGGDLTVVERDLPKPGPEQVRIEVEACGVCHGDAIVKEGGMPGIEYPRVPGHEVAGRVDEVGTDVADWSTGDRVCVGWHGGHCFTCNPCRSGDFTNCVEGAVTGATTHGGYAEYMLANHEALAEVPDGIDATVAGPLVCAGLTAFNSIRNAPVRPGGLIAIQGIGGVGHMGLQYASSMGFETVGLSSGPEKEQLSIDLGSDHFVNTVAENPVDRLKKLGGADLLLATAPSANAIESVMGGLAENGCLLVVAPPHQPLEIPAVQLINNRQSIKGWYSGHPRDSEETLEFSASHDIQPMVETFSLEDADDAYEAMMANDVRFRAVLTP